MNNTSSGPVPPDVPTEFETQNGTAIPSANLLIVNGIDSTENDLDGIIVKGGVVGTGTSNKVDVVLTNRITGTATTTDAVTPQTVYSFPLGATPGTYNFFIRIVAYNQTSLLSASYTSFAAVRTTGAAGTLIGESTGMFEEEGAMTAYDVANSITGNTYELIVTGYNADTVVVVALTEYVFGG